MDQGLGLDTDNLAVTFEMTCRVIALDQYGYSHIQTLNVSIEVISRLTSWLSSSAASLPIPPGTLRRLQSAEWTALLEAMISTLTDPGITAAMADLADVDPILVTPPRNLHVVSGQEIAEFLPPMLPIPVPQARDARTCEPTRPLPCLTLRTGLYR